MMSFSDYEWLAAVVGAHTDHRVVGRTRLQKELLLLQDLGLPTSYQYAIHFYGPYCEDLQSDVGLLKQFALLTEEERSNQQGVPYYMLTATPDEGLPEVAPFRDAIEKMEQADAVVLELAATYKAFRSLGSEHDEAMIRLRRKKGRKCDDGRDQKALDLLADLALR